MTCSNRGEHVGRTAVGADLRAALDALPQCAGVFSAVRDSRGRILDFRVEHMNAAACANNALSQEQQLGQRLNDLMPGHRESGLFGAYCGVVDTGRPFYREALEYTDLYGTRLETRHFEIHAGKLGDGFVATWREVPAPTAGSSRGLEHGELRALLERQSAELRDAHRLLEGLRASESRYRELYDASPDLYATIDAASGLVLECNRTLLEATGFQVSDIAGRDFALLHDEPSREAARACLEELRSAGDVRNVPLRLRRREGEPLEASLSLSAVRDGSGRVVRGRAVWRDMSELRRVEHELRRSRDRLLRAEAGAEAGGEVGGEVGLWEWEPDTGRTLWSQAMWTIYGHEPDPRADCQALFEASLDPVDRQRVMDRARASVAGGEEPYQDEFRIRRPDGAQRWIHARATVLRDAAGRPRGLAGVNLDVTERREAQERELEQRLFGQRMLDGLFSFVGLLTLEGTLVKANRAPLEAAGVRAEDVLGRPFWDCCWWSHSEEEQERLRAAVERARAGEVVRYDACIRVVGDGRMWVDMQLAPLRDERGRITHLVPSAIDITARRAAEENLRRSWERFRAMADELPLIVWLHDADGRQEFVNRTFCEYFGVLRWEMTADRWKERMHPQEREAYAAEFAAAVRERRPFHGHVRVRRADGAWRWLESWARPRCDAHGAYVGHIGASADVTERVLAEERLRQSEERFRALADSMPQLVWTASADGTPHYYNRQVERYGGVQRGADGSWSWAPVVHEEERQETLAAWRRAIEEGASYEFEHRLRMADGSFRWHLSRARRVETPEGPRWFGTATDIHDLKLAEEALQESTREMEQEHRRKDLFLATLGHELRNPLAALAGALQVQAQGLEEPRELQPRMSAQVEQLARLVDDLLDVSRVTRGKIRLRRSWTELRAVVEAAAAAVEEQVRAKGQQLELDLADSLEAQIDAPRVEQVVCNLLVNAMKFTPEGGHIALELRREGEQALISVRDDGRGLRPEQLERIFQPFEQEHPGEGGLGLGLVLVKSLVELHGGAVEVASEGAGKGSRFSVRLPIGARDGGWRRPAPKRDEPPLEARVLLIDDVADVADTMALLLRHKGAETRCAYTGRAGIELFRQWRPDVALIDIGLPDLTGYEVARAIRAEAGDRPVLLVAVTGFGDRAAEARIAHASFDRRMLKPVGVPALLELIRAHLGAPERDTGCDPGHEARPDAGRGT